VADHHASAALTSFVYGAIVLLPNSSSGIFTPQKEMLVLSNAGFGLLPNRRKEVAKYDVAASWLTSA
jgi:hypothetical protein